MGYRFGGLVPRFYYHGRHKLLPEILTLDATALSDSLHDLPLLGLGKRPGYQSDAPLVATGQAHLPHIRGQNRYWSL